MKEAVNWWSQEHDAIVLSMTAEGHPASHIGKLLGRSKSAVQCRHSRLTKRSVATGKRLIRFTAEEDAKIAELSDAGKSGSEIAEIMGRIMSSVIKRARVIGKPLHAKAGQKKRERPEGEVIPFPRQKRPRAAKPKPVERPKLIVVSHNIPLMVEDWLAKNGGARRFADNDTTNPYYVAEYLREHGVYAKRLREDWNTPQGKWTVSRGAGRPRAETWAGILRIADGFRIAEGLQPFLPPAKQLGEHLGRLG
ncbi:hypothetical protein EN806_53215 [bacterium M00.F.Ca.ET.163.01.1.1]|nr:hypothetical protein EN806_53215 [bacterium M00.F.Ca.ET.163.01.1.1]